MTFQATIKKTLKVEDRSAAKSFDKKKSRKTVKQMTGTTWKAERPKSANLVAGTFSLTGLNNRLTSSELPRGPEFKEKIRPESGDGKKHKALLKDQKCSCRCNCCWRVLSSHSLNWPNLDSRSWSGCYLEIEENELDSHIHHFSRKQRKCRRNSSISNAASKKTSNGEIEFHKVKRSLGLLGFKLADFGITEENLTRKKPALKSASFSTKILNRSISLDSLRAAVKRAWIEDCFDESHRRLLADAAYEEWYFKKERELCMKRNEEKLMRIKVKENLQDHFERRKVKSEEEFQKWLQTKKTRETGKEKILIQNQENSLEKVMKAKEESENAITKWRKTKEEELKKKRKMKIKENERRKKAEQEKYEKKIIAEKAFQQWKTKLKENQAEEKKQRQRKRQEKEEKRKRMEEPRLSFEKWKALKDEQIKERTRKIRQAWKMAKEERLAQLEERMYVAEQAFEDWLEKVESRKQKQYPGINNFNKTEPWIPV